MREGIITFYWTCWPHGSLKPSEDYFTSGTKTWGVICAAIVGVRKRGMLQKKKMQDGTWLVSVTQVHPSNLIALSGCCDQQQNPYCHLVKMPSNRSCYFHGFCWWQSASEAVDESQWSVNYWEREGRGWDLLACVPSCPNLSLLFRVLTAA